MSTDENVSIIPFLRIFNLSKFYRKIMASSDGIIELGFIDMNTDHSQLKCKYFVSKIGGKPLFLDLENLPSSEKLICQCGETLIFLLQIYAPIEDNPDAFHRTLYIFCCLNKYCIKGYKVFRSQIPQINKFYEPNPSDEENDDNTDITPENFGIKLCLLCGSFASRSCDKCEKVNYCSQNHQILDWQNGHSFNCGKNTATNTKNLLFPEYEILIEEEQIKPIKKYTNENLAEILSKYKPKLQDENLMEYFKNIKEDKTFARFKAAIAGDEDQIIRYYRNTNKEPLWICDNKPLSIPSCSCGEERIFEFQVMPQLLNYLEKDIDFGVLVVYTCKKSCPIKGYIEEYIFPQFL